MILDVVASREGLRVPVLIDERLDSFGNASSEVNTFGFNSNLSGSAGPGGCAMCRIIQSCPGYLLEFYITRPRQPVFDPA